MVNITYGQKPITDIKAAYARADFLYNLENPTESSDSESLELFLQIAKTITNPEFNKIRIESLIKGGNIHQGYGRFLKANSLYHLAIIENQRLGNWPFLAYEAFLYLGSSMYFLGVLDSSKFYFEEAVKLALANGKLIKMDEQPRLYNSLGAIYFESADYNQAILFFKTALELASARQDDYNYFYTSIKSNIATCLIKMRFFDSAIQVLKSLEGKADRGSIVFQPLAHAYYEKGDYTNSLKVFQLIPQKTYLQKVSSLNYIGRIYMQQGNLSKAIAIFDSAISLHKSQPGRVKNKDEALTYLYRSELAFRQKRIAEALNWVNNALGTVHLGFNATSKYDLPADVENTVSPITFYQILTFKASLLMETYRQQTNPIALEAAVNTYIMACKTINYIAQNFDNDDAKLFLIGMAKKDYESALEAAFEAYSSGVGNANNFLFILESYKGTALRQNIEFARLKQIAGIPKESIKREAELKQLYAAYLTRLNLSEKEQDSKMMQKRLTEIRVELSALQNTFKKNEIFSRLNQTTPIDIQIKTIQADLDGQIAILNYFVGEKCIYLLGISKQSIFIQKNAVSQSYKQALRSFMSSSLNLTEGSRYKGFSTGQQVFNTLLAPVYKSIQHYKNIIIIPDDYLFYLPFDALDPSGGDKEYLVRRHSFSTHYSVALFRQHNAFKSSLYYTESVVAFAPFTKSDKAIMNSSLPVLPFSEQEVINIESLAFKGSEATKAKFLKTYNHYNILHLATHASLGKDSSSNWIQFYPQMHTPDSGRLFIHEIYNLNLSKNNLVVLSACETGAGLSVLGEGLLSLSRAFMYAGSKGIVSTLYKTDDRVTAFLMDKMYQYLRQGYEPAIALQKSKLALLQAKEINPRFKSPNYWGNFVYIGKVPTNHNKSLWLWILIPLMLMIKASIWRLHNKAVKKLP